MLKRFELRIVFGTIFVLALKDILSYLRFSSGSYSVSLALIIVIMMLLFVEWIKKSDESISLIDDIVYPLLVIISFWWVNDKTKFIIMINLVYLYRLLKAYAGWKYKESIDRGTFILNAAVTFMFIVLLVVNFIFSPRIWLINSILSCITAIAVYLFYQRNKEE